MKKRIHLLISAVLAVAVFTTATSSRAGAEAARITEYQVKATYIYKFINYVTWPGDKDVGKQKQIDVCLLGKSNFKEETASIFSQISRNLSKNVNLIEESQWKGSPGYCHIIYIGESEESRLNEILTSFKGRPILTLSDVKGFSEQGGMIEFVRINNTMQYVMNIRSITSVGMRVDVQILKSALKILDK